jgi:hypothetical protein
MRNILIILFISIAATSFGQTPQPTGKPTKMNDIWYQFTGYIDDSLGILLPVRDTNFIPRKPCFIFRTVDSTLYFYNKLKWVQVGSPKGLFVTNQQLIDSLSHYVTLNTFQIVPASKEWSELQQMDDTLKAQAPILNNLKGTDRSVFVKRDSLKNAGGQYTFNFRNELKGANYSKTSASAPVGVVTVNNKMYLNKQPDTLNLTGNGAGSLSAQISFDRLTSTDTLNITNDNGSGSYNAFVNGVSVTNDSADLTATTPYWNVDLPLVGTFGKFLMVKRGNIKSYTDVMLGTTVYADNAGSPNGTITTHTGLDIVSIKSSLNTNAIAINQEGANDSILAASSKIQTPNVPSSGTIASSLNMDANGNWIKKTYLPTVSATLDFPSTTSTTVSDLTVTVTGAALGDIVKLGVPNAAMTATASYFGWVSSANTISIRYSPKATENPASATFNVSVEKQ